MMRRLTVLLLLLWALPALAKAPPPAKAEALSDAAMARRPSGGEYFGVYLMDKKIGWVFSNLELTADRQQVKAVNEIHFKMNRGKLVLERSMKDARVYEAKPNGRLLSFVVEQKGDGGDQRLEGTNTEQALTVVRKRPQTPDETLTLKPSPERVEDADQPRVALLRNAGYEGQSTDGTDLKSYKVTTRLDGAATRTVFGVQVKTRKTVTVSEKEKVPTEAWFDDKGRLVESFVGPTMHAVAEPEDKAKTLESVEVFGLTRIELPSPLPSAAHGSPSKATLVMTGVPEKFRRASYRQSFEALKDPAGAVRVTISAKAPVKRSKFPLSDPNGGVNLENTIIVEANDPAIKAQAKAIAGDDKDAWSVSKKVARWVYNTLEKDYASSSDHATDVLKLKKGDCTEHSLLTVALLRSLGIPAKRVDGVIYMVNDDKKPAYYWHEWVEAYVGEWTQLDPTFGQDEADATHFQVGEEADAEITPLIGTIKVLRVE